MWLAATRVSTAPGQRLLTVHRLAGGDHGQAARRGDAQRVHGLADHQLAQHRAERRAAVAAAGIRRRSRAFELHVHAAAVRGDLLAEQDGAAVAEAGEVAELMAGVGLRQRLRAVGQGVAGEDGGAGRRESSAATSSPSAVASTVLKTTNCGSSTGVGADPRVEQRRQIGVGVLEAPAGRASRTGSWRRRRTRSPFDCTPAAGPGWLHSPL